jgi:hypothetical protein
MPPYAPGDQSKAVCAACEALMSTTFAVRDVPFRNPPGGVVPGGVVHGILVAVCDACGTVVGIPAQSTPAVRAALLGHAAPE